MIEIRRVGNERRQDLVRTLAAAFAEDPFIGWVLADSPYQPAESRVRWWTGALTAMADVAVLHATQDSSAVAVWVPSVESAAPEHAAAGAAADEESGAADANDFVAMVNAICGAGAAERLDFFAELYGLAPPEPHWHLTAVAVAPAMQNRGLGRRVIGPMLAQCDRLGVAAYLEATTPRSRALYHSLGFELLSEVAPQAGPTLALMWREPT